MIDEQQRAHGTTGNPSPGADSRSTISAQFDKFEKRQSELWWLTFIVLLLLGVAYVLTSWNSIRSFWHRAEATAFAAGLVVLIILFAVYMWKKTQEISELPALMRSMHHPHETPPSEKQIDQLFSLISKSQQGYRDLIDSFDDVLLAVSLDGQIRAANRSFSDLVGTPFQEIVGRPLADFVQDSSGDGERMVDPAMPRFMERRQWAGVVQLRLKSQSTVFHFDCVPHAMIPYAEFHTITALPRADSPPRNTP